MDDFEIWLLSTEGMTKKEFSKCNKDIRNSIKNNYYETTNKNKNTQSSGGGKDE